MKDIISLENFWIKKVTNDIQIFQFEQKLVNVETETRSECSREIPADICSKLKSITNNSEISLFVLATTILSILIYKYSSIKKFCITTFNNKNKLDDDLVFLVSSINDQLTLRQLIFNIKDELFLLYRNLGIPSKNLIERINIRNGVEQSKLFNVGFAFKAVHNIQTIQHKFDYFFFLDQNSSGSLLLNSNYKYYEGRFNYILDFSNNFIFLLSKLNIIIDKKIEEIELLNSPFLNKMNQVCNSKHDIDIEAKTFRSSNKIDIVGNKDNYWKKKFEGEIPVLDFPKDRPRPKVNSSYGKRIAFEIEESLSNKIRAFCRKEGVTMFIALLGYVKTLLYRYTGQNDIVVGIPVPGMEYAGMEEQPFFYSNKLAIRTTFEENTNFKELINRIKETTLDAYKHQADGFEKIAEELIAIRDLSHSPLFNIMVILNKGDISKIDEPALNSLKAKPGKTKHINYDVLFNFIEQNSSIICEIEYNGDIFDDNRFNRLKGHLLNIIEQTTNEPTIRINEFDILTEAERHKLLYKFCNTKIDYSDDETVVDLFEKCVDRFSNNIALVSEEGQLTYKEFYKRVIGLAGILLKKGLKPNDIVAIITERSIEMVIGIYAILKAGGAYLPIDTDYPLDRIKFLLLESGSKIIVTNTEVLTSKLVNDGSIVNDQIINLNDFALSTSKTYLPKLLTNNLAYIIYTSGSTGKPKGVMIEHHSLYNIIKCLHRKYPLRATDSYLLKTSYTFDVSVVEIFGWFLEGGTLSILPPGGEREPEQITSIIQKNKITHINFVPSMFSVFIEEINNKGIERLKSLIHIFLAGEELPIELVKRFNSLNTKIFLDNIYGPTEATIYSCSYSIKNIERKLRVPIGKPLDNIGLYVVDKNNKQLPIGVPGELCIGGDCLARGYHNSEELTKEKFIQLSFLGGERVYKSGDLVRWLPDGDIEFLGRIDNQVKIRGFRIELGEIESCMESIKGIKEAVASVIGDNTGNKRLLGYYTSEKEISEEIIHNFLSERLPLYMVPNLYMHILQFPKTNNGKTDRKRLPFPKIESKRVRFLPSNKVEEELVEIWSEVLGIEKSIISTNDIFFALGGNSISVISLVASIFNRFSVEISIKRVFQLKSIQELSKEILSQKIKTYPKLKSAEKKEYYPLSSAQLRLFFIQMMDKSNTAYNMLSIFKIEGHLDYQLLQDAFNKLIQRHDSLRTSFIHVNFKPFQFIHDAIFINIEIIDACGRDVLEVAKEFEQPFSLDVPPLLRVKIFRISNLEHFLLIDLHHIISDAISNTIIVGDIINFLNHKRLDLVKYQFKDYSEWQISHKHHKFYQELEKFWQNELLDYNGFELPTDFSGGRYHDFRGASVSFELDGDITAKINNILVSNSITVNMFLFSIITVFLNKLTNSNDLVIGLPVIGRRYQELQGILGMFVNLLPIRCKIAVNETFKMVLQRIKERFLLAIEHQDYQYDDIIANIVSSENNERTNFIKCAYNFEESQFNFSNDKIAYHVDNIIISPKIGEINKTNFDLLFTSYVNGNNIAFRVDYSNYLFHRETILKFVEDIKDISRQIVANPYILLSDIKVRCEKKEIYNNIFQENNDFSF